MIHNVCVLQKAIVMSALLFGVACQPATPATICVNQGGTGGCFQSIGAAVKAAAPGDTIQVAHGTYKEYVVVPKSLSLIGEDRERTIIDALGKPFGINVDGFNNVGLSAVTIVGFTIRNANNAGIVISNASNVTVSENSVLNNDRGLVSEDLATCPSLASFPYFTEAADCGEGIFLSGIQHSTVVNNRISVDGKAGGILISDETGPTHDNVIEGNCVVTNTILSSGIKPSQSGRCLNEGKGKASRP
jgi:nitrous oxidase accessory protein NosD